MTPRYQEPMVLVFTDLVGSSKDDDPQTKSRVVAHYQSVLNALDAAAVKGVRPRAEERPRGFIVKNMGDGMMVRLPDDPYLVYAFIGRLASRLFPQGKRRRTGRLKLRAGVILCHKFHEGEDVGSAILAELEDEGWDRERALHHAWPHGGDEPIGRRFLRGDAFGEEISLAARKAAFPTKDWIVIEDEWVEFHRPEMDSASLVLDGVPDGCIAYDLGQLRGDDSVLQGQIMLLSPVVSISYLKGFEDVVGREEPVPVRQVLVGPSKPMVKKFSGKKHFKQVFRVFDDAEAFRAITTVEYPEDFPSPSLEEDCRNIADAQAQAGYLRGLGVLIEGPEPLKKGTGRPREDSEYLPKLVFLGGYPHAKAYEEFREEVGEALSESLGILRTFRIYKLHKSRPFLDSIPPGRYALLLMISLPPSADSEHVLLQTLDIARLKQTLDVVVSGVLEGEFDYFAVIRMRPEWGDEGIEKAQDAVVPANGSLSRRSLVLVFDVDQHASADEESVA